MLGYKSKMVLEVPSPYTTTDCSRCGNKVAKALAVRVHRCDRCGLILDRDYNASLNILQRGLQKLPVECGEVTPAEIQCESAKQELRLLVFDR
jgi:putative transposase